MKQKNGSPAPQQRTIGQMLRQTVLLVLVALLSISAATFAWFSIADSTRVRSMGLEITSGASLRFDLSAHERFQDYIKTLSFDDIAREIQATQGYDPLTTELEPVTSTDSVRFALEDGTGVEKEEGKYYQFELHFMATQDMMVHLTSENGDDAEDGGTRVETEGGSVQAIRIGFVSADRTAIYQPSGSSNNTFSLASAEQMSYDDSNALFWLPADTDVPVTVSIWLEGEDPSCTDEVRGSDYRIQLRFQGADEAGNPVD